MYAFVRLSDNAVLSTGPLPQHLAGLPDDVLRDLSWVGEPLSADLHGHGYWPLIAGSAPAYDDVTEQVVPDGVPVADPLTFTVTQAVTVVPRPDAAERLAAKREEALADLETSVTAAVRRYVREGRDLPYAEKHRQALEVLGGGAAGVALTREAAARGVTVEQLAAAVKAKADAWDAALGEIEDTRLAAVAAIAAAATGTAVDAVIAGLVWPEPAE